MGRKFLKALQQWCDLPEKEREKYRVEARENTFYLASLWLSHAS